MKKPTIKPGTLFRDERECPPGNFRTGMIFQVFSEHETVDGDWWCRSMNPTEEVGTGLYAYKESYIQDHLVTNKAACDGYHILGERTEDCAKCFAAVAHRRY